MYCSNHGTPLLNWWSYMDARPALGTMVARPQPFQAVAPATRTGRGKVVDVNVNEGDEGTRRLRAVRPVPAPRTEALVAAEPVHEL